jgi:hypothetical protein
MIFRICFSQARTAMAAKGPQSEKDAESGVRTKLDASAFVAIITPIATPVPLATSYSFFGHTVQAPAIQRICDFPQKAARPGALIQLLLAIAKSFGQQSG